MMDKLDVCRSENFGDGVDDGYDGWSQLRNGLELMKRWGVLREICV